MNTVLIWDTSAINGLLDDPDRSDLIARMKDAGTIHRIPFYVLDEIAANQRAERRSNLLAVCRELKSESEMILLLSPWHVIEAGVRMFWEAGNLDWEILFGRIPEYEEALTSGHLFDDELARVQKDQNRINLQRFEEYVGQAKRQFANLFLADPNHCQTLSDIITRARAMNLVRGNAHYICESILGHAANREDFDRFFEVFLPLRAMIYAFLFAHYRRNEVAPTRSQAGAIDLLASVYLPICHKLVTNDQDQQAVLREVSRCCQFQAETVWFTGTLKKTYLD
jgi:hypothetical protein